MRPDTPVQYLKGVGPKTAEKFARLGVATVEDLLGLYPRRYVDYSNPAPVAAAPFDADTVVKAAVYSKRGAVRLPGGRTMVQVLAGDDSSGLTLTWFNTHFAADSLQVGEEYFFEGRIRGTLTRREMANPTVRTPAQVEKNASGPGVSPDRGPGQRPDRPVRGPGAGRSGPAGGISAAGISDPF